MTTLQAVILAVVEGLTEYLPISSTGHLIITSAVMGINENSFTKDFTIIVQFGAILSVLVLYWRRFLASRVLYARLFVAFLPAAIVGLLLKKKIDLLLGDVQVVAWSLIIGGIVLLFVDRWFKKQETMLAQNKDLGTISGLTARRSAIIGIIQCLAFLPGVSRSAATIVGGLSQKLTRREAAEFSFLLAVPTLTAATALKLLKIYETIQPEQISAIVIGNIVSFVVGAITIKLFLGFLTRHGFFWFGVYRILIGAVLLFMLFSGHEIKLL